MPSSATFCQSVIVASYIILMILSHKNMTIVISSTVVVSISCIMCLTSPEIDDDDNLREQIVEVTIIEADAIAIQINDENVHEIETPVLEQPAVQINHDSFDDPNTPQAKMVATVVQRQCY